jgi:hypothetical protein
MRTSQPSELVPDHGRHNASFDQQALVCLTKPGCSFPRITRRPILESLRDKRRTAALAARSGEIVALRPPTFYDAVGRRLAAKGAAA